MAFLPRKDRGKGFSPRGFASRSFLRFAKSREAFGVAGPLLPGRTISPAICQTLHKQQGYRVAPSPLEPSYFIEVPLSAKEWMPQA